MQRIIEFARNAPGELFQQAHHAFAVLIDGQAEAQTKLGVILKQGVCPCRATSCRIGGFNVRVLTIFGRANFDAQVAAGAILWRYL